MDLVRSSIDWGSIMPKLHVLAHHAADCMDTYGSSGIISDQALEACNGYFNCSAKGLAARSFLESFVRLVKRASESRGPADVAFNRGKRRASAEVEDWCAKRLNDLQTTRARMAAGRGAPVIRVRGHVTFKHVTVSFQRLPCGESQDLNLPCWARIGRPGAFCCICVGNRCDGGQPGASRARRKTLSGSTAGQVDKSNV